MLPGRRREGLGVPLVVIRLLDVFPVFGFARAAGVVLVPESHTACGHGRS
jgi:hypothetical protein